jgi:hypothetical protein
MERKVKTRTLETEGVRQPNAQIRRFFSPPALTGSKSKTKATPRPKFCEANQGHPTCLWELSELERQRQTEGAKMPTFPAKTAGTQHTREGLLHKEKSEEKRTGLKTRHYNGPESLTLEKRVEWACVGEVK